MYIRKLSILATALSLMIFAAAPAIGGDQGLYSCPPGNTKISVHSNPDDGKGGKLYYYINDKSADRRLFRVEFPKESYPILYYRGKRCVQVDF